MSHARGKAEAAEGIAQKALEECRLARMAAKELSPSFHIYENGEWTGEDVQVPDMTPVLPAGSPNFCQNGLNVWLQGVEVCGF